MAIEYRDYGTIGVNQIAPKVPVDTTRRGQVYEATHTGEGDSLPFLDKAYISFTYGGKKIEDFDLLAVTAGDRLQRNAYSTFEDLTTDYSVLDGQFYWGSRYQPNELTLNLFTDGITYDKLEDFRHWFRPGEFRELILAEHPNRGIMARIKETPRISMLPFREKRTKVINGQEYEVTIGLYKGSIELTFVMDDPFWYAINNVLGQVVQGEDGYAKLQDKWIDANGKPTNELTPEMLKIVVEDMIPLGSMITQTVSIGGEVMLAPSKRWKYTLSDKQNVQKLNEFNKPVVGTPLVNNEKDDIYLETGAIVGPIYYLQYSDNAQLTKIPDSYFKMHWKQDDDNLGRLKYISGQNDTATESLAMVHKLAIKAGSTIECNSLNYNVIILTYDINDGSTYKGKGIITADKNSWECEEDCQIYFFISRADDQKIVREETASPWKAVLDSFQFNLILSSQAYYTLKKGDQLNYFYSGTAPSFPTVQFSVPIRFDDNGYIVTFADERNRLSENDNKYNTLCLEGAEKHELRITNLNIFSAYNSVIKRLKNLNPNEMPIVDAIEAFRLEIAHPVVRDWIIGCIYVYKNNFNNRSGINSEDKIDCITQQMKNVLLSWMPYLFVSLKDSGVTKRDEQPSEVNQVKPITNIKSTYNSIYYNIKSDLDNATTLMAALNQDFTIIISANNATVFQWQYQDKNTQGTNWFRLSDSEFWTGTQTSELKFIEMKSQVFNYKFRCMISNDKDIQFTKEFIFQQQDLSLSIQRSNTGDQINVTEKSKVTLKWKVQNAVKLKGNGNYALLMYKTPQDADFSELTQANLGEDNIKYFDTTNSLYKINYNKSTQQITATFTLSDKSEINNWQFTIFIKNVLKESLIGTSAAYTLIGHYLHLIDKNVDISRTALVYRTASSDGSSESQSIPEQNEFIFFEGIYSKIDFSFEVQGLDSIRDYLKSSKCQWYIQKVGTKALFPVKNAWGNNNTTIQTITTQTTKEQCILRNVQSLSDASSQNFKINDFSNIVYVITNINDYSYQIAISIPAMRFPAQGDQPALPEISYTNDQYKKLVGDECTLSFKWSTQMLEGTTYQWQFRSLQSDEDGWENKTSQPRTLKSSQDSEFKISPVTLNDEGYYQVILALEGYSYTPPTNPITLKVRSKPSVQLTIDAENATQFSETQSNKYLLLYDPSSTPKVILSITASDCTNLKLSETIGGVVKDRTKHISNHSYTEDILNNLLQGVKFQCFYKDAFGNGDYYTKTVQVKTQLNFSATEIKNNTKEWTFNWPRLECANVAAASAAAVNYRYHPESITLKNQTLSCNVKSVSIENDKMKVECTFFGTPGREKFDAAEDKYTGKVAANTPDGLANLLKNQYELNSLQYQSIFQLNNPSENLHLTTSFITPSSVSNCSVKGRIVYYNNQQEQLAELSLSTNMDIFPTDISDIKQQCTKIVFQLYPYRTQKWDIPDDGYGYYITGTQSTYTVAKNTIDDSTYQFQFSYNNTSLNLTSQPRQRFLANQAVVQDLPINKILNRPSISQEVYLTFDCQTGQYNAQYQYNEIWWPDGLLEENDNNNICYLSNLRFGTDPKLIKESVGDMVLLNQFVFNERNHFDERTGKLVPWSQKDKTACHKLTYDGNTPLNNFKISYKNYYL